MNRRDLLSAAGRFLVGAHVAAVAAPIVDLFWDAPSWSPNVAITGIHFGYGTVLQLLLKGRKCGWPYLHTLCHAYAVASMDAPDAERIAWSRWGGLQDELTQQFWAQHYRRTVHPQFVESLITNARQSDYTHAMLFCWGTPEQKLRAEKRIRLVRGPGAIKTLQVLDVIVHGSRDACESAWQRSDELDNETGRQIGIRCPRIRDDEARLAWCEKHVQEAGIIPSTPEGEGTSRPFGNFHPLHPGEGWETHKDKQEVPFELVEPQ